MDGSVSVSQSERSRAQTTRTFANRTANEAHTQSELFEQLLNLNFTVQPPTEKPPTPEDTSSTASDDSICDCQDKNTSPVEEERDDEDSQDTIAALIPANVIEEQKPVALEKSGAEEVQPDKPVPETKLCDLPKVADEVIQPTAVETTATTDEAVVVQAADATAEVAVTTATDDSTKVVDASAAQDVDAARRGSKEKKSADSNVPVTGVAEQVVEPNAKTKADSKPDESRAAQAEAVHQNTVADTKNQTDEDRRGDRREKWFERDTSTSVSNGTEAAKDSSLAQKTSVDSEPALVVAETDSQLQTALAADTTQPSVELPTAAPTTSPATPIAVPVNLVTVPQASNGGSNSGSASTSGEPNHLGPAAPTRTVGTQAAKADASAKPESTELSQQERVRVIQRIARSFNRISAEGGTINLRLHPEHLGSVTVQVKLEGRTMAARLTTETAGAREAIMADLPALRQRLADQGFDVTKFQVDVAGNGADATFAQTNGDSQSRQYENRSSGSQIDYRRVAANREARLAFNRPAPINTIATALTGTGIDLQV